MTQSVPEQKRALRDAMSRRRAGIAPPVAAAAAERAASAVMACGAVRRARRVALYAALQDELPSRPLFDALRDHGSETLFPRVRGGRPLRFCAVDRWEDLMAGTLGILEPPRRAPRREVSAGDVVVVPCVAFDRRGHRLGRGGGYYDRTMATTRDDDPIWIGYGYDFQLVDAVPHEEHDHRLDAVVTDAAVHHCRAGDRA